MSTRIALNHRIDLRFEHRVQVSTHWLRLRPAPHARDRIEAYSLKIEAEPNFLNWCVILTKTTSLAWICRNL